MNMRCDGVQRRSIACLTPALLWLAGCAAGQPAAPARPAAATAPAATQAVHYTDAIKPNDRVLFLGDEMTQSMFYSRAIATALLALMPDAGLRFYNGGMEGATAGSAAGWVDGLLQMTSPTVVFLCFGLNDGFGQAPTEALAARYQKNLGALIARVQAHPGVRLVLVLGPPAIQPSLQVMPLSRLGRDASNPAFQLLSRAACAEAARRHAASCDLFAATDGVNTEAGQAGVPLSLGGNLPNEIGHMVLAGAILSGLGVSGAELDQVGWPPLLPRKIGPIRPALAPGLRPTADPDRTQRSIELYDALRAFDETFFRAWRLGGKSPSLPTRESLLAAAEQVWGRVRLQARAAAGGPG
jgi:lysophospholipase L1-like esterase